MPEFEMTEAQLDKIKDAGKPVPYMVIGGVTPSSPQENANRAWQSLGEELGFDWLTVQPSAKGERFFTAESTKPPLTEEEVLVRDLLADEKQSNNYDEVVLLDSAVLTAAEGMKVPVILYAPKPDQEPERLVNGKMLVQRRIAMRTTDGGATLIADTRWIEPQDGGE